MKSLGIQSVKVKELVMDQASYPRLSGLSPWNVGAIQRAMEGGAVMPPIRVEKSTMRISDGWHRTEALRRTLKNDENLMSSATILAEMVEYEDDKEFFVDTARLNITHGQRLSEQDIAHCIVRAEELGISQDDIMQALNISPVRYGEIVAAKIKLMEPGEPPVILKPTTAHFRYMPTLTKDQVVANKAAGGQPQVFYANQLISLIERDAMDLSNANLVAKLERLYGLLNKVMGLPAVKLILKESKEAAKAKADKMAKKGTQAS